MLKITTEVLELTKEAVAIARGDRIVYLNAPAKELLGDNCSSVKKAFGAEIASAQASGFVGSTMLHGKSCILRVSRREGSQTIFFSRPEAQIELLNDAVMFSLRSLMMTCGMATDICRTRAEALEDTELSSGLAMLSKNYYSVNRLMNNMAAAREVLQGKVSFEPVNMDLAAFVRDCVQCAADMQPAVKICYRGPEQLMAAADYRLIQSMLANLISNALLHAEGCTRISVDLMEVGEMAALSVSDDGAGMTPAQLHSSFERYRHVYSPGELCGGAGLGLTAVRGAAEAHGGTLLLESREGQGTTARFSLRKKLRDEGQLRAGELNYGREFRELLLGLADCVDEEFFKEKYMD